MSWFDKAGGFDWLRTVPGNPASQNGYDRLERLYNVNRNPSKWSYQDLQNALDRGTGRSWRDDPNGQAFVNDWLARKSTASAAPAQAPKPKPKPKVKAAPKPAPRVAPQPKVTAAKAPPPPALRPKDKSNVPNYTEIIKDLKSQLSKQSKNFGTKIQDYQKLLAGQQTKYQQQQTQFEKQLQSSLAGQASQFQKQLQSSLAGQASQFQLQQLGLQKQYETAIGNQAAEFQAQRQALEEQSRRFEEAAQQSQQQLMIGLAQRDRTPAAVKMAESGAAQQGLTSRGTTGYFGRKGMRIGSLNVPTSGLTISAGAASPAASGSFM